AFRRGRRVVVVPGGGPFADAVRRMFKRVKIGEDAAHWMAVLGKDQYAHALAARLPDAALVDGDGGISAAVQARRLPVLAPYHWLRAADPLPHSWEVTRSEEHTSELSHVASSYAAFCLKKKKKHAISRAHVTGRE